MQAVAFKIFIRHMSSSISIKYKPPIPVFGVEGRYVSALYSAGVEKKQLEDVEKKFKDLKTCINNPVVVDFIETSIINRAAKSKVLMEAAKTAGMPEVGINFLGLVAENGRLKNLRKMINMFLSVMVAHRKEAECEVITAEPLNDETRKLLVEAIKKIVKDKSVTLTERVDPSIIGGMIIGIEDKHIDMSISRKLQMYTEILTQSI